MGWLNWKNYEIKILSAFTLYVAERGIISIGGLVLNLCRTPRGSTQKGEINIARELIQKIINNALNV